jgi:hypothetical protein
MKRLAMLLILVAAPSSEPGSGAAAGIRGLPTPEHVSPGTRGELKARMGQHGATMSELVRAVVLLDRPTVRVLAGRIADEEMIAHASGAVRERHPLLLPPEVFQQQSGLSQVARELAATAAEGGGDDRALADRFSALARTCVSCHSVYLHGRPDAVPLREGEAARSR